METSLKAEKPSNSTKLNDGKEAVPCSRHNKTKRTCETHKSKRKHCREEHLEIGP